MSRDQRETRFCKLKRLRAGGRPLYPDRFERTHTLAQAARLPEGPAALRLAGRLMAVRTFGKLTFGKLADAQGSLQIALDRRELDPEQWRIFHEFCDRGDFLGVKGPLFRTRKGELTLRVESFELLAKALRPLPEKWHGLKDPELRQRRRYLDLIMSEETRERFAMRTRVVRTLRRFLDAEGFDEVETPVLQTVPSGAAARPFRTHHNALDLDLYLRIAPETWLKRLIVGGYDKVYEFARCFRNEGMDPSHLQDFTMLEYYCAYWNWEDNLAFTEKLVRHLLDEVCKTQTLAWRGREIDFSGPWPRYDLAALIGERTGIDLEACPDARALRAAAATKGLRIEQAETMGRGNLIDAIYKTAVRDDLIQPCFLTGLASESLPLARRNDARPEVADCFQLVVNGWEIVKAYSELIDPLDQRARFVEQERLRTGGDEEAMFLDEDYLLAMEYGMPPVSGWGMGLERICALLTGAESLRDVTLFPLLRPVEENPQGSEEATVSGDVEDLGITREQALALFRENVTSEYLTKHCLASAAVLEAVAERFGKNRDAYWCIGLLHDLDFDRIQEPDRHTRETVKILREKGVRDEAVLKAILAHNAEGLQDPAVERTAWLDFALSCSETITGLILATALVMPDKKLASVKASSVRKRIKRKDFAKKVNRDLILQCDRIGLDLDDFCALALQAMQAIAPDLGL